MTKKNENVTTEEKVVETSEIEKDEKDEKIIALEEKIASLTSEIEKVKKAAADIVNRNKQLETDKKFASSDLIKKLLVPLSYFEGALKFESDDEAFNNFLKGFKMIYNLILDTLKSDGLEEITANINDEFDPHLHEVSELVEVLEGPKNVVLEVIQKGFSYKKRVIKPVQVKVSTIKQESEKVDENKNNDDIVN